MKKNEIKSKKLENYYDITSITNFDKKILVKCASKMGILNLNLEIEAIIYYYNPFNDIYEFYINNYISFYSSDFIFINNKKYLIFKYDIPYLFHPYNNKIIFGRLRNEKNSDNYFQLLYEGKKILILYSNNLLIYQSPN